MSSQKRRGFLKKLSLWGHQAGGYKTNNKKLTASPPPVGRPSVTEEESRGGIGEPEADYNYRQKINSSGGQGSPGSGRRANSVTRIEVAAAAGRSGNAAGEGGDIGGKGGGGEGVDTPTPPLLDPRLSKSLSPSSRKQQSAYSSYIRSEICSHTMS